MTRHQILTPADHGQLRLLPGAGAELGDAVMACLTVPAEFRRLACEFPLVFRRDPLTQEFTAQALLGLETGENLFVANGRWETSCRPWVMAVQPFLIGRPREPGGAAQVHVDIDHPRISRDGSGLRVFEEDGRATPLLEEAAAMLAALDEGYRASAAFYRALARYELLEPFSMDVTLTNGAAHRLVGYHIVNEERFRGLESGALNELHGAGHLLPACMAIASVGNLAKLVARKNRLVHG
jgi:hypothetical protein